MLDKENQNQGYLCGRLFAVLDKIQEDANGIHSIRERYMNAASATPSMDFCHGAQPFHSSYREIESGWTSVL